MQQHILCNSSKNISNDPKQMLISELYRQDREEANRIDILAGRPIDQRLGASDQYIVLDSSQRDLYSSDPSNGLFVFNIVRGGTTGSQMIGLTNELNDIVEIEMQSFPMPDLPLSDFLVNTVSNNSLPLLVPNPNPTAANLYQIFTNRFIVEIKETSVQSYSDAGGVRHNFAFDLANANGQLYASPASPVYVFTDPITSFVTLSLVFRNPPRTLRFSPDILSNSRLAILDPRRAAKTVKGVTTYGDIQVVIRNDVDVVIDLDVSLIPYNNYVSGGVGTIIDFDVAEGNTLFSLINTGANTFTFDKVNIDTSTRILFNNIKGIADINLKGNGVYNLTGITEVGVTPNIVYTFQFTRTTDLDTAGECEKYSTVGVLNGKYFGRKFYLTDVIVDIDATPQIWKDTTDVYLSIYYPNHEFPDFDAVVMPPTYTAPRIKIDKLNQKTLPYKLYNYLTQKDGLYVGKLGIEPDYFRLNPDVQMSEFIYNSWANNYITRNVQEVKQYGFDTLRNNQVVIVPGAVAPYTTDFTDIIPGKSFIVGPIPPPPSPVPRVTVPQNFIISLTGQALEELNGLYQLETLDDIKPLGIRLTKNTLIMPLCNFDVIVPSRQFKIPMRFRRVLRRVTNMSGI